MTEHTRNLLAEARARYRRIVGFSESNRIFAIVETSPLSCFTESLGRHRNGKLPARSNGLCLVTTFILSGDSKHPIRFVVAQLQRVGFPIEVQQEVRYPAIPHLVGTGLIVSFGAKRRPVAVNRVRFLLEPSSPEEIKGGRLQYIDFQPTSF